MCLVVLALVAASQHSLHYGELQQRTQQTVSLSTLASGPLEAVLRKHGDWS